MASKRRFGGQVGGEKWRQKKSNRKGKKMKKQVLVVALLAVLVLAGCVSTPKAGQFQKNKLASVPAHPTIMILDGGKYKSEPITDKAGQQVGYTMTKHHWLVGDRGTQLFMYPKGATNVGSCIGGGFFGAGTKCVYDLNGKRYLQVANVGRGCRKIKEIKIYEMEQAGDQWKRGELVKEYRP